MLLLLLTFVLLLIFVILYSCEKSTLDKYVESLDVKRASLLFILVKRYQVLLKLGNICTGYDGFDREPFVTLESPDDFSMYDLDYLIANQVKAYGEVVYVSSLNNSLKSNEDYIPMEEELVYWSNKLNKQRSSYNRLVMRYNRSLSIFPISILHLDKLDVLSEVDIDSKRNVLL